MEEWEKDGINYWDNEDCPREYLEQAYVDLIYFVEGVEIVSDKLGDVDEKELRKGVEFYEYVADK